MSESEDDVKQLLAGTNHAVVGVNRATGPPQLTVVWFLWDGETFRFSTTRSRAKYLNLKRDPSISLLIDDFEKKFYVVAYGRARLIEEGHDTLARPLLEKYLPERTTDPQWNAGPGDRRAPSGSPHHGPVAATRRQPAPLTRMSKTSSDDPA